MPPYENMITSNNKIPYFGFNFNRKSTIYHFLDKWEESLKVMDLEQELSYCINTKAKPFGKLRSPNGLVSIGRFPIEMEALHFFLYHTRQA